MEYYSSLNGLRGYAAISIAAMHVLANITTKPSENYLTHTLIPFSAEYTLLFMIISAFSICCSYYTKFKNNEITLNSFYKKRYLRILPFFGLLCLLDFCLNPSWETFCQVFTNITLCFGLLPAHTINVIGVGWFLGIVFLFYLLFPFFVFILYNKHRALKALVITILFVLIIMSSKIVTGNFGKTNFIFCAPFFVSGGVIYIYRKFITKKSNLSRSSLYIILVTLLFFLLKNSFTPVILYLAELVLFSSWVIYAVGHSNLPLLNNKVISYLSGISMEIYLSHMVFFRIIEKMHLDNYIQQKDLLYCITVVLTIIATICFSHVMKYYIIYHIESFAVNNRIDIFFKAKKKQ